MLRFTLLTQKLPMCDAIEIFQFIWMLATSLIFNEATFIDSFMLTMN